MKILEKFSSLKAIKFVVGNAFSPSLLHDIALQFTGSQTLRCIHSVSDYIIYGAEFCPKLQYLSMPVVEPGSRFAFGNSRGNDFNVTLHRDLGYILKSNTNLKHLRLDSPVCDMVIDPQLVSNLKSLCLTSMHQNVIQMFSYTLANRLALPELESISLDLDYSPLPQVCLERIAIACPKLKALRIKHGYLSEGFIHTLCERFSDLESLRLTRCDIPCPVAISWAEILTHISGFLTKLKLLHLKNCFLVRESTYQLQRVGKVNRGLEDLKVLDIHEGRLEEDSFLKILRIYPNVTKLRMDINNNCFPGPTKEYSEEVYKYIRQVEILELRFGKPYVRPDQPMHSPQPYLYFPNLKTLTISSSLDFPDFLIKPNEKHIEYLRLDYAMTGPPPGRNYNMRKLKTFTIRAYSHLAESICTASSEALLEKSANLQKLHVITTGHKGAEFDGKLLERLVKNCPRLKSFTSANLRFRLNSIQALVNAWPDLELLDISGSGAIGSLNQEFEDCILKPLLNNHRHLAAVSLGVTGLNVAGDNNTRFAIDDSISKQYPYLVGASRYGAFRSYEAHLAKSFPQVTFQIRGPVEDAFRMQRTQ